MPAGLKPWACAPETPAKNVGERVSRISAEGRRALPTRPKGEWLGGDRAFPWPSPPEALGVGCSGGEPMPKVERALRDAAEAAAAAKARGVLRAPVGQMGGWSARERGWLGT